MLDLPFIVKNDIRDFQCVCGRRHSVPEQKVLLGEGMLSSLPQLLAELDLGKKALLVSDENVFSRIGKRIVELLGKTEVEVETCVLEKPPGFFYLEPDENARSQIGVHLQRGPDFIVAVGSGVINDLCKFVACRVQKPYIVIATAPSMDGYSSPGAPMLVGGYKVTFEVRPPRAIIMDLDILSRAPLELIQAGFSDLMGKTTANADWTLRHYFLNEYMCEYSFDLVKEGLEYLDREAASLGERSSEFISNLSVALFNSGLSMALVGDSRPASGLEHLVAHYLEIFALHRHLNPSLHGLRVGAATVVAQKLYTRFLDELHLFSSFAIGTRPEILLDELKLHFGPLFPFVEKEAMGKLAPPFAFGGFFANTASFREKVKEKLFVVPLVEDALKRAEIPSSLRELGFGGKMAHDAFRYARFLRKRVTLLDLLDWLGVLEEYLNWALEDSV